MFTVHSRWMRFGLTLVWISAAILVRWTCPSGCATGDLAGFRLALYVKPVGGIWQSKVRVTLMDPAARGCLSPDMGAWLHPGDQWRVFVQSGDAARNLSAPAASATGVWE